MKKALKTSAIAAAAATALIAVSGTAFAGDCKSVKFKFTNHMGSKIQVKSVTIAGNDGTWTENITNKVITTNGVHTTGGQHLNKLDSGKKPGYMTVNYDKWDANNGRWLNNKALKFTGLKTCADNTTYAFDMK